MLDRTRILSVVNDDDVILTFIHSTPQRRRKNLSIEFNQRYHNEKINRIKSTIVLNNEQAVNEAKTCIYIRYIAPRVRKKLSHK